MLYLASCRVCNLVFQGNWKTAVNREREVRACARVCVSVEHMWPDVSSVLSYMSRQDWLSLKSNAKNTGVWKVLFFSSGYFKIFYVLAFQILDMSTWPFTAQQSWKIEFGIRNENQSLISPLNR